MLYSSLIKAFVSMSSYVKINKCYLLIKHYTCLHIGEKKQQMSLANKFIRAVNILLLIWGYDQNKIEFENQSPNEVFMKQSCSNMIDLLHLIRTLSNLAIISLTFEFRSLSSDIYFNRVNVRKSILEVLRKQLIFFHWSCLSGNGNCVYHSTIEIQLFD